MRENVTSIRPALERCWKIADRGGVVYEHERDQYKKDLAAVLDLITPAILLDAFFGDEEIKDQTDA